MFGKSLYVLDVNGLPGVEAKEFAATKMSLRITRLKWKHLV
jgi:hypothetical protein